MKGFLSFTKKLPDLQTKRCVNRFMKIPKIPHNLVTVANM